MAHTQSSNIISIDFKGVERRPRAVNFLEAQKTWKLPLDAALAYARAGWKIFPCHYVKTDDGKALPEEDWKKPPLAGWPDGATTDVEQIKRWWRRWPDALIGHRPGDSGHLVIDIDMKGGKDGEAEWTRLGLKFRTMESATRNGGRHLWWLRGDLESVSNRSPFTDIDIRCDNGYVILPGPKSGGYTWENALKPQPVPRGLVDLICAKQRDHTTGDGWGEPSGTYEEIMKTWRREIRKRSALRMNLDGTPSPVGVRSAVLHRMQMDCAEIGMSREDAFVILQRSPMNKFSDQGLKDDIDRAYAKHEAKREADGKKGDGDGDKARKGDEKSPPASNDFDILTSREFIAEWEPPDWFVDGVLQRGRLYAMTGVTGHGKTAVAMRLALSVVLGGEWGGVTCEVGDVVYFAGENPDDVRTRWIAMDGVKVHFVKGTEISLREDVDLIKAKVMKLRIKPALIIVDTKAAFFEDEKEEDNVAAQQQASDLRELTTLPGNPAVIVLCHPTKYAKRAEELIPRGGGAFVAAIDGNMTCIVDEDDGVTRIHHSSKWRGADFEPLEFMLESAELPDKYRDTKGRLIRTVIAVTATEKAITEKQKQRSDDELDVMRKMRENPGLSWGDLAKKLRWVDKDGKPLKSKVQRIMKKLKDGDLVEQDNEGHYRLTSQGEQHLKERS